MRTIPNASDFRREDYRQIIRIESTHVSITESEVLEGSFTFDSTMVENSSFQIGTAIADEVNVTVVDPNGELTTYIDDTYQIYISAIASGGDRSLATWTLLGEYVVAELDTSYSGRAKVKFQDRMVTLDVPVDFQTGTLYANLQNLGVTLSLTQEEITFLSGLSVLNRQTMTKRDFIRGCALLMWENAYLKADGSLAFRALTTTAQSFTPSDRFSSELGDAVTIGPVRVIDDSGAVIYTMGSASGQKIEISSTTSPMISLIGSIEGLATYYGTATIPGRGIADFSYIPLTMSLLSTWALEPGDVVSYIDKASNTYTSLITSVAHVLNGASACTSAGEAKVRQSQQIPVQTDETRAVIQQLETGIDTAQSTASEAMPKYGVCSTAANVATKEVDVGTGFILREGARVAVLMQNSNTSTGTLKLNVNTTGAKDIVDSEGNALGMINGQTTSWLAGSMVTFVYTRNKTNTGYVWRVDDNFALTRINNILTEDIVGDHGWINLKDGFFNFDNKLIWDIVSGTTPTLTVEGTINATNGTIGGFTANGTTLYKDTTLNNKTHRAYIQAPATPNADSWAFGVRNVTDSDHIFLVRYDGKLFAKDAEISGTISGSTITGSTLNGANIVGQDFDVNIRADITGPGASDTYNKKYIGITTPNTYYDSGWRIFYPVLQEQVEIRNSSDQTQIGFRMMIDPFNAIRFQAKGSSDSDYYTAVTIRGSSMTVNGTISASGSISSDGSICSGGKASVWDSNAGGIMTSSGVLSLRANSSTTPGLYVTAYGSSTTTYDAGFYYNATDTRWQSNKQIYAPSFYATGRIDVGTTSVTGSSTIHAITQGREIELITQATGTCGLYDITNSKWIAYMSSSGARGPVASTTEVGFMSVADKTKLDGVATGAGRLRRVSVTSSSFTAAASGAGNVTLTPTIPTGYSLVGVVLATTNNTNVGIVRTNSASGNTAVEVRYKNFATTQQTGVTITVSVLLSNGVDIV